MKQSSLKERFSIEFTILILIIGLMTFNLTKIYLQAPSYAREFEDFDQFAASTIDCNHQEKNDLIDKSSEEGVSNDKHNKNLISQDLEQSPPKCPIDEDRLKHRRDYKLSKWLNYKHIQNGGHYKPSGCVASQNVAVILPYRDRAQHLEKFSLYIHQFLPDQLIEYTIYVIEQADGKLFNRAKLFNIAVQEISKLDENVCCYIFHDVDMLPLDQRNLYMCTDRPRHLSPNLSTMRFHLIYPNLFGGVIALTPEQFNRIGGFSNDFFGWGGEDDDIYNRVKLAGYLIDRTPSEYGDYHMLKHVKNSHNPDRMHVFSNPVRKFEKDNGKMIRIAPTYELVSINQTMLYTTIAVNV